MQCKLIPNVTMTIMMSVITTIIIIIL